MLKAGLPWRFSIPFASSAGGGLIRNIPQASQIGIQNGAASLTDGFPPLNFQPVASGGVPPFGEDFNGILFQISSWCQWFEAGGPINYDSTFATGGSNGYPQYAIVQSNVVPGNFWMSTVDNNQTDPDSTSSANWVPLPGLISSGTPVASFSSTIPTGFVAANTLTIGNASSNATGRANADTLLAYRAIWQQFSNTACPILTSGGGASTRGANPDADFNANKQLTTPDMRGRGVIGVDTMGGPATTRLTGVPVTLGSVTSPTAIIGENLHALITAELAVHAHGVSDPTHDHTSPDTANFATLATRFGVGTGALDTPVGSVPNTTFNATGISIQNAGSGTAHNTVSQNVTVYWNIKL